MSERTENEAIAPVPARSAVQDGHETDSGQLSATRFLTEWLLLTALMAASYWALDAAMGGMVTGGIAIAYILYRQWPAIAAYRKRPKSSWSARWTLFYAGIYQGSGGVAAMILTVAVLFAWMSFAYDPALFKIGDIFGYRGEGRLKAVAMILLILMAAFYLGPLVQLRRRGTISGSLPAFIRADMAGLLRSPLVMAFALTMALFGLLSTLASATSLESLVNSLIRDRETSILDVAGMFPFLPLGLLAATALLAVSGASLMPDGRLLSRVRTHLAGDSERPAWPGMMTVGASLVIVAAIVYPLHLGMIGGLSAVAGISPLQATNSAVRAWIAAQQEKGTGRDEILARLNKHGRWTPDAPAAGLATLLPDLGAELSGFSGACTTAIAAAATDPSAVAGNDRMSAETARSKMKYCLRVVCPSPVAWQAPPALLLYSSHPSQNRFWQETIYIDVFADGVAAAPGGYCTADGELAADFQG